MATWTDPATINTGPDDPVTSEFGTAALENVEAFAEGASGAPKLAMKHETGAGTTGNVDFTVTNYGGASFFINVTNSSGSTARNLSVNVSDGSFGTAQTIISVPASSSRVLSGYWIEATGEVEAVSTTAHSATVTKTSGITTLRFTGATDLTFGVHVTLDGGEPAT
jgi:hypothetical protein